MDDALLSQRVGVYAASAFVREDRAMRNRQKLFSQWTDLAFSEQGSSRIFRFVRGPQAAARFLRAYPCLAEQKQLVAEALEQPGSRSPVRDLSEIGSANLVVLPQQFSDAVHLSEAVEAQALPWKLLWKVGAVPFDVCAMPIDTALPVAMPTPAELRATIATYSWHTAVGVDHWSPRHLELLSDHLLSSLAELYELHIRAAVLPRRWDLLSIYLIPKDKTRHRDPSKYRPISLTNTGLKMLDRK